MKKIIKYACAICNQEFDEWHEAKKCEDRKMEKAIAKVGDIVFVRAGYGWYDGDMRWIMNPNQLQKANPKHGNCFGKGCTLEFFYVITAIDKDPKRMHRLRYHIFTKAMSGKLGHREGYTFIGTHFGVKIIKNPPKFVVQDSKDLLGKKAGYLF